MSTAPASVESPGSPPTSSDGAAVESRLRRAAQGSPSITVIGRLRPAPLGRLGRGLMFGTGLFLLRPLLLLLHRLVGWRREGTLTCTDDAVTVRSELQLLGCVLRTETERLSVSRIVSASQVTARSVEPVALGALALVLALVWGLVQIVDGVYGRSLGLVVLGMGAIAAGVVVDLVILWLARLLPDPHRYGVVLRGVDGRQLHVDSLPVETAERFAAAVNRRIP
ncbi:MAG: hypothetical protein ABI333_19625 [bacterium]